MITTKSRSSYPTRAQIARAVQAARENGVIVQAVETLPDGTIRVGVAAHAQAPTTSLFDELNAAGQL